MWKINLNIDFAGIKNLLRQNLLSLEFIDSYNCPENGKLTKMYISYEYDH